MRRQYDSLALMLFIFLTANTADANTFEVTPTLYFFNYQEFDQNGALLNIEEGVIPGIKLRVRQDRERVDRALGPRTRTGFPRDRKRRLQGIRFVGFVRLRPSAIRPRSRSAPRKACASESL